MGIENQKPLNMLQKDIVKRIVHFSSPVVKVQIKLTDMISDDKKKKKKNMQKTTDFK